MLATLFIVILITFIGVGLPDSILGTAWPSIYEDLGFPLSMAGYVSSMVSVGTILSSLLSARLINRFGTGLVAAVSTFLTAIALFGYAFSSQAVFFFLLAIPLGLGAGCIDTALNSFVALHYSAAKMSFLHCFYGIGVAASPFVLSLALGEYGDWRRGYLVVAILQSIIAAVAFVSLPLWRKIQKKDEEEQEEKPKTVGFFELLKIPVVRWQCLAFFGSCAFELSAGMWCSSYFVNSKGLNPDRAALITMVYYIGLTTGRFLSGVLSAKLGRRRILRLSLYVLTAGTVVFLLPSKIWLSAVILFFLGLGIGPIYPNLVHLTPKFAGKEIAQSVMGAEQAFTYVSIMVMPWLFGVLAQVFSTALFPYYLLAMLALYAWIYFSLMRAVKRAKNK